MLAIPARLAGCEEVLIATPPRPDGSVAPEVEYCGGLVRCEDHFIGRRCPGRGGYGLRNGHRTESRQDSGSG